MSYKLTIIPQATEDIKEVALWYNNKSTGLGKRFAQNIKNCAKNIKQNPFAFAVKYENKRVVSVDKFPYLIHYRIDEIGKEIIILAVLHTSRNPEIWDSIK
jgi:plasmid stabilization system protein ParE